jgi:hypothetical protein
MTDDRWPGVTDDKWQGSHHVCYALLTVTRVRQGDSKQQQTAGQDQDDMAQGSGDAWWPVYIPAM